MSTLNELAGSIAKRVHDYREGEIPARTSDIVMGWAAQFREDVQVDLLTELDHVLAHTYFGKDRYRNEILQIVQSHTRTSGNACENWSQIEFLNIQTEGNSQREMLSILDEVLWEECRLKIAECGGGNTFAYFDDGIFTGNRVRKDLSTWIERDAPQSATLIIATLISHSFGEYRTRQQLYGSARKAKKDILICFESAHKYENRFRWRNTSAVLFPTELGKQAEDFLAMAQDEYPFSPREPGRTASPNIFSSEGTRQILETELLTAGLYLRKSLGNQKLYFRPLGFGNLGLGFGAMTITYRNCPNTCPLGLWWSVDDNWYPLFPRRPNEPSSPLRTT